jgi:hypothetical protein
MKLVKELRFGRPKTGKTRNVVDTYPRPLLLFNFDPQGWESVKTPVSLIGSEAFRKKLEKEGETWPEVTVLDYSTKVGKVGLDQYRTSSSIPLMTFIRDLNALEKCPFKTVVLDSLTSRSDLIWEFVANLNSVRKLEFQHWGMIQSKAMEIDQALLSLSCHTVLIAHEGTQKDEITGEIRVLPLTFGKYAEQIGMVFSQVLYATTELEKGRVRYVVYTAPKGLIRGIGVRWPDLPPVVGPTWGDLYGKEVTS